MKYRVPWSAMPWRTQSRQSRSSRKVSRKSFWLQWIGRWKRYRGFQPGGPELASYALITMVAGSRKSKQPWASLGPVEQGSALAHGDPSCSIAELLAVVPVFKSKSTNNSLVSGRLLIHQVVATAPCSNILKFRLPRGLKKSSRRLPRVVTECKWELWADLWCCRNESTTSTRGYAQVRTGLINSLHFAPLHN